jgi:hypothetical protein
MRKRGRERQDFKKIIALITIIKLCFEGSPETNTQVYLSAASVMKKNDFLILTPGACVIKLITAVIYLDAMVKP